MSLSREVDSYSIFDKKFQLHSLPISSGFGSLPTLEGEQFWPSSSKSRFINDVVKKFFGNLLNWKKLLSLPKARSAHHDALSREITSLRSLETSETIQSSSNNQSMQEYLGKYKLSVFKVLKFKVHIYWERHLFYIYVTVPRDIDLRNFKKSVSLAYGFELPSDCVVLYHTKNFDIKNDMIKFSGLSDMINASLLEFLFLKDKIRVTNSEEKWKTWMKNLGDEVHEVTMFAGSML